VSTYLFAQAGDAALLIEDGAEGVFLYTIRGDFIGDTWHPNVDEAKAQASYHIGSIVGPWRPVAADFAKQLKTHKT
jgi:hypothetical protein